MRPFLALLSFLVVPHLAAQAAAPAEPKDIRLGDAATFSAEGKALTSFDEIHAFANKAVDALYEFDRAARVDGLVIEKDEGKWTLTGWIFLRAATDGVRYRAAFFGEARFQLTPPIRMEKDQVKRFLGTESIDVVAKSARFTFTGADDQQFLESLTYTPEAAKACETENEDCRKWLESVREFIAKGETADAAARRRFGEFGMAFNAYARLLDPKMEASFTAGMAIDVPEGTDKTRPYLTGMQFDYNPSELEEVSVRGTWNHGKRSPSSVITRFHARGQYDATSDRTASSAFAETESKTDVEVTKNTMTLTFAPGAGRDMRMKTVMDCVVTGEDARFLVFYVTGFMGVTKATVNGQDAEHFQPAIPGREWEYSGFILVAVPRVFKRGETLQVGMELEGKILYNVDGNTYMVKEEDLWFPTPNLGFAGVAARFDTTLLTPKGFTALANGREQPCDAAAEQPDMQCARFVTNTGIDFATFNIGRDFRVDKGESMSEDANRDGQPDPKVPIRVYTNATAKNEFAWVDPDNPALVQKRSYSLSENGPDALGSAQIARKVYTDWFGPCPYDTLMITPHPKGHGRGSASLLLVSQEAFLSSTANAEWASLTGRSFSPFGTTAFLVHEIAHQWWGGAVRIRGDRDQWFSEGFSDYAACLVLEELDKINGTKWFEGKLTELRKLLMGHDGYSQWIAPLCLGNRFASAQNRPGYTHPAYARQNFMYSKGAYVMHSLRMLARAKAGEPEAGDKLFKQAMHDLTNWCVETGRAPSNVDMENILSKGFGMKLDWFFDQWIYGMGVPSVDWSYQVVSNQDGTWTVKGKVRQKDTSFQFPLAVSFFEKNKELGFAYAWVGKKESDFSLGPLPFKPEKIQVNTEEGVLGFFKEVPWQASAAGM